MSLFKTYKQSYTFPKEFWKTVIIDAVTVLILCSLFLGYAAVLEQKAAAISAGRSVEQLKLELLAADEGFNKQFLSNVRWFAAVFFAGSVVVVLLALIIFSYSRQILWRELCEKRKSWKLNWRWNGMILVMALFVLLYGLLILTLRLIINAFITVENETIYFLVMQGLNVLMLLGALIFLFTASYSFLQKGKVWEAVGNTFDLLRTRWSTVWKVFVLSIITGIILSALAFYIDQSLFLQPLWLRAVINGTIFLLFISWMRLYVVNTLR